jgi:hypothetical protein
MGEEMRESYDFSKGVRGQFFRANKVQKTLRLDADILEYFQKMADQKSVGYQTLINQTLRESIEHPGGLVDVDVLRKELKKVIQRELKSSKIA